MEAVNLMQFVPLDMYKSVLVMLDMPDLLNICQTNIYASTICDDDNFWYEYIVYNYDPKSYGIQTWNKLVFSNFFANYKIKTWKTLAFVLSQSKTITVDIFHLNYRFTLILEPLITIRNVISIVNFILQSRGIVTDNTSYVVNLYISNKQVFEIHKGWNDISVYLGRASETGWTFDEMYVTDENLGKIEIDGKPLIDIITQGSITDIQQIDPDDSSW
jgi:hypothetical protein